MMRVLEQFEESHKTAMEKIKLFLEPSESEPDMSGLVKWMLSTDANPYSYLGEHGSRLSSAVAFLTLCRDIEYRLCVSEEITFVTVNNEPRIVFAYKHDDALKDKALTVFEKRMSEISYQQYIVEILDVTPDEWCVVYDEWYRKNLKGWFLSNALPQKSKATLERIECVAESCRTYQFWNEAWLEEAKEMLNERSST